MQRHVELSQDLPEIKLPCRLIGCSKCCYNTEMPLSEPDMRRLERLGYKREEFAVRGRDGTFSLRNVNGRCVFLENGRCKVYDARPIGCRLYPLVCIEGVGIAVDAYCPLALVAEKLVRENPSIIRKASYIIEHVFGFRCPPRFLGVVKLEE